MKRRKEGRKEEGERQKMSSLRSFRSISSTAVNFLPFHGRQPGPVKRRWGVGGGGRGESEGRAVPHTHTCSFSHQHTVSLLPLSLFVIITHTHTHFLPPLSSHPISLVTFSFTHSHAAVASEGDPLVSLSPEAPTYPREPCCGTTRVATSELQVPSFISSHFRKDEREIPWERKKKKITRSHKSRAMELR